MMPPVIILAGGKGTRLHEITRDKIPKPMIPIPFGTSKYPFLSFVLQNLYNQGFRQVLLCVDHLANQIETYYGDGRGFNMEISYDYAGHVKTGSRVRRALLKLDSEEALVHCGDVFHPLNYRKFFSDFRENTGNLIQISVHDCAGMEGIKPNLSLDDQRQIVGYKSNEIAGVRQRLGTGVLAVRKGILQHIPKKADISLTKDIYPMLINRGKVGGIESKEVFFDVGTPREYDRFSAFVARNDVHPIYAQRICVA